MAYYLMNLPQVASTQGRKEHRSPSTGVWFSWKQSIWKLSDMYIRWLLGVLRHVCQTTSQTVNLTIMLCDAAPFCSLRVWFVFRLRLPSEPVVVPCIFFLPFRVWCRFRLLLLSESVVPPCVIILTFRVWCRFCLRLCPDFRFLHAGLCIGITMWLCLRIFAISTYLSSSDSQLEYSTHIHAEQCVPKSDHRIVEVVLAPLRLELERQNPR